MEIIIQIVAIFSIIFSTIALYRIYFAITAFNPPTCNPDDIIYYLKTGFEAGRNLTEDNWENEDYEDFQQLVENI